MRNIREQPRVTAARMLGAVLLVGVGIAIGTLADGDSERPSHQRTQAQLERSERAGRRQTEDLHAITAELKKAERRSIRLARDNARLRHELRRQRRTAQRQKPKR